MTYCLHGSQRVQISFRCVAKQPRPYQQDLPTPFTGAANRYAIPSSTGHTSRRGRQLRVLILRALAQGTARDDGMSPRERLGYVILVMQAD